MARIIEVVPHDPQWAELYRLESALLIQALGSNVVAVHHAGSTAIPGIFAKPTIDILMEVQEIDVVDGLSAQMILLGYENRGEQGIPGRRYFLKKENERHLYHLHIFKHDHPEVTRMLAFRDYLVANPELAQAYSQLKLGLAEEFRFDPDQYTDGKSDFIRAVDQLASSMNHS